MMERSALRSVSELSQFIETGEFRYAAQAIKPVRNGQRGVRWFEWLLRPVLIDGSVTTMDFVDAVESLDLALDLDMRACRDGLTWLDRQPSNTRLTINVANASFSNRLFCEYLVNRIQRSNVLPKQVCFDITVHDAVSNLSAATRFAKAMRRIGCKIALDNGVPGNAVLGLFGPLGLVDYLKIDRQWVSNAPESKSHRLTLESVVDYGHRLHLKLIAKGVDSAVHLQLMDELGVDFYQGYIDGEPQVVVGLDNDVDSDRALNRSA